MGAIVTSARDGQAGGRGAEPGQRGADEHPERPATQQQARAAAASTTSCHGSSSDAASGTAAPRIAPTAAGPAPSRNARAARFPRSRSKRPPPSPTTRNDGAKATAEASSAPAGPAAAQPTTATVCTTGPGVSWPKATASTNSARLIQPYASTASDCINGMITKPPP